MEPKKELPNEEATLACRIYSGLRGLDPHAFVQGDPLSGDTLIDGTFNLRKLAEMLLADRS